MTEWGSKCKLYLIESSRNMQGQHISKQQQQRQDKGVIQINRRRSGQAASNQNQGNSPGSKHDYTETKKHGRQDNGRLNIQSPEKTESVCATFKVLLM